MCAGSRHHTSLLTLLYLCSLIYICITYQVFAYPCSLSSQLCSTDFHRYTFIAPKVYFCVCSIDLVFYFHPHMCMPIALICTYVCMLPSVFLLNEYAYLDTTHAPPSNTHHSPPGFCLVAGVNASYLFQPLPYARTALHIYCL